MQPEQSQQLRQLQRRTAELAQLARDLGQAIPPHVEGSDATGWVLVVLGHDGLPTEIRVREGWRQRLGAERLASAVLDANSDAVRRAMQSWATAVDDGGWWRRRADFEANADEPAPSASRGMPHLPFGHSQDSNDLAEEVLRKLHQAQTPQAATSATVEGQDDERHVTIRVSSSGLTDCTIDPDWAQRHDGASISAALSTALQRATAKRPASPSSGRQADDLIGDALATLNSLTRNSSIQGGNG